MSLPKFLEKIRAHYHKIVVVIIFVIAVYHRIRWIIGKPQIDGDEKWQLAIMNGSFFEMLRNLQLHEHCSYLAGDYLVIYPFFKIFGFNKWGLAIPHLTLDLLGIFFLYLLAKRYINGIWGYIITLGIVSFNRPLIMYSAEVRTYAALPFLAVLSLYFAQMLVENGANLKRWQKIFIGMFYVATLWFHVYGVVIVFCTVLYSLFAKSREKSYGPIFKRMAVFFGVVLLIAMPFWCYCVIGPHLPRRLEDTFLYIPNPFVDFIGFSKGVFCNLVGYKYFYFLLLGAIVPFVLPVKDRGKQIGFFLTLVMLPLSLLLLGVLLQHYWFIQRQFTWVVPFFALYLGWAWQEFFNYAGSRLKMGKA